jgi:hypothetical protein
MSGRCGAYVYSWFNGKQHWHRYVVPADPRTPAQLRRRAAFGAASRAWSEHQSLTEERRDQWRAAAARIKSTPRLSQSGFLTGQQHFVGANSVKPRWGLPLLLEPPNPKATSAPSRKPNAASIPQVQQPPRPLPTPSHNPQAGAPPKLSSRRALPACAETSTARRVRAQLPLRQHVTSASSDRLRTPKLLLPVRCRRNTGFACDACTISSLKPRPILAKVCRKAHCRELWRGG